jgi:hypothetical protein
MPHSTPYAHELVLRGMDMVIQEPAEVVLQMELARLDAMMASVIYTRAVEGDKEAINTVLKVMDRRYRLLGLDKLQAKKEDQVPTGVDITVTFVSPDGSKMIDAEYARAMAITGGAPACRSDARRPLGTDLCLKFHPLLTRKAKYEGYWGGRGSGKLIAI